MIWKRAVTLEALNAMGAENMVGLLDIQFTRIGDNELEATMPVDCRTHQPFGLLRRRVRRAGRNAGIGGGLPVYGRRAEGGRSGGQCQPHPLRSQRARARRLPGAACRKPSSGVAD